MSDKPIFSDEFKAKLEMGKYTSWAANLTEDVLLALLWMVGEYGGRVYPDQGISWTGDLEVLPVDDVQSARMAMALEVMARIQNGEKIGKEEALARIREAANKF